MNPTTTTQQGCRICLQPVYHDLRCRFAKGLDSPVQDFERGASNKELTDAIVDKAMAKIRNRQTRQHPQINHYWREEYNAD